MNQERPRPRDGTLALVERKALIIAAIAVVAAGWWWNQRPSSDAPADVVLTVARQEWGKGFCAEPEQHWACLVPTEIELASHLPQTVHGHTVDGQGYCFLIQYQLETTLWDPRQGVPFEPRTYVAVKEPIKTCAVASRVVGDASDPNSWSLDEAEPLWWIEPVRQLEAALCARSNNCTLLE